MTQDELKQLAAQKALDFVPDNAVIGIGSGTTVNYFIEALATIKHRIEGAVASSEESAARLKACGIPVFDLNVVDKIPFYFDGADEINSLMEMIKGGGGAHTREKILAAVADEFVCMVDESKKVKILGAFPLAIEVIPMARSYVARKIVKLGGDPVYRQGFVTDNGNCILDIYNLKIYEPIKLEQQLNNIEGVVSNGLFAARCADKMICASMSEGVIVENRIQT